MSSDTLVKLALTDPEVAYARWRVRVDELPSEFQNVPNQPTPTAAQLVAALQEEPYGEQLSRFVNTAERLSKPSKCGQSYRLGPYADVEPQDLPWKRRISEGG
ncbi:hypothetical protein WJX74_009059 [Apatococcus lobatus]|uniref:Uncharacterized protein n=1 Tax=Apatococcus lobatus TaxID=904363 RepID=A0AAW1QCR1_9CHLO